MFMLFSSCGKDFLDIKPDKSLLIPKSLADMQALLDNTEVMNRGSGLNNIATDDYAISSTNLATYKIPERNSYLWADDIFEGQTSSDWNIPYQQIFYANVVLDGLKNISAIPSNQEEWNRIKGSALFFRAMALYQLANQFAETYHPANAATVKGVPIKLNSDVNERVGRGSLSQVFDQIINDLNDALPLLPTKNPVYLTRPSKWAVNALLARIYLYMGRFENAQFCADECLKISPVLLDYNSLSKTSTRPISFNVAASTEVIFWQFMISYSFGTSTATGIADEIIAAYDTNDLRKTIFLRDRGNGIQTFKGNYSGDSFTFIGLATDEMYLIRAECKARKNDVTGAMEDLNTLRRKRWNNSVLYPSLNITDAELALRQILSERQKELITRGTRWTDLKRLNLDKRFEITIKRLISNKEYILSPNSNKYTFPIPQNEINGSDIEQNQR